VAKNQHIACLCGHGLQIRAIETDYETEHILAIWVIFSRCFGFSDLFFSFRVFSFRPNAGQNFLPTLGRLAMWRIKEA
jgi:hypothetical protein